MDPRKLLTWLILGGLAGSGLTWWLMKGDPDAPAFVHAGLRLEIEDRLERWGLPLTQEMRDDLGKAYAPLATPTLKPIQTGKPYLRTCDEYDLAWTTSNTQQEVLDKKAVLHVQRATGLNPAQIAWPAEGRFDSNSFVAPGAASQASMPLTLTVPQDLAQEPTGTKIEDDVLPIFHRVRLGYWRAEWAHVAEEGLELELEFPEAVVWTDWADQAHLLVLGYPRIEDLHILHNGQDLGAHAFLQEGGSYTLVWGVPPFGVSPLEYTVNARGSVLMASGTLRYLNYFFFTATNSEPQTAEVGTAVFSVVARKGSCQLNEESSTAVVVGVANP